MVQLVYFEKQKQRSVPWNCELQIGSQLEIKVSAYVYVISSVFLIVPTQYNPIFELDKGRTKLRILEN